MSNVPLPEPIGFYFPPRVDQRTPSTEMVGLFTADQMRAHAAAVSAADNAALRAELAKHQESEFHPDWSMLEATRDSLAEHQEIIRDQRERIKVLEDALWETYRLIGRGGDAYDISKRTTPVFRAALGDKTPTTQPPSPSPWS